jgi:HPt (histidine-containing phosphotransfer) domain-containing protein
MTPDPLPEDLQQALDLFRSQFAEHLPARLAEARAALDAWRTEPGSDERLRALHRVLHRLAGSAGTFGMPALGDAARAIELQLDALLERTQRGSADVEAIAAQVEALEPLSRA